MRNKANLDNIDNSNPADYPNGRIKDNTGAGDGTPVSELVYGDIHEFFAKLMRLAGISFNGLPENETNGYQLIESARALPGIHDVIYSIGEAGGKLSISRRLNGLRDNEFFVAKAGVSKNTQAQIRSTLDQAEFAVAFVGDFVIGDNLRITKMPAGNIQIERLISLSNIDQIIGDNNYLKAATNSQELAGTLNNVATTPLANLLAFVERINGADSASSLAQANRNGLYPKEHFQIVQNIGNDRVRNVGNISGLNPGGMDVNDNLPRSGDISSAIVSANGDGSTLIRCTLSNAMDNTSYFVRIFIESQGDVENDNEALPPVFRIVSTTTFDISIDSNVFRNQSLKIHLEAVQI